MKINIFELTVFNLGVLQIKVHLDKKGSIVPGFLLIKVNK